MRINHLLQSRSLVEWDMNVNIIWIEVALLAVVALILFKGNEDETFKKMSFWYCEEWCRLFEIADEELTSVWGLTDTLLLLITSTIFEVWLGVSLTESSMLSICNKRFVFVCNASENAALTLVKLSIFVCKICTVNKLASRSSDKIRWSVSEIAFFCLFLWVEDVISAPEIEINSKLKRRFIWPLQA